MSGQRKRRRIDGSTIGFLAGCTLIALSTVGVLLIAGGFTVRGSPRVDWETLLVGAGAIVAATFTIRQVRQQIDLSRRLAAREARRSRYAARAILPVALSSLCDYAEHCVKALGAILPEDRKQQSVAERIFDDPDLDDMIVSWMFEHSVLRFGATEAS